MHTKATKRHFNPGRQSGLVTTFTGILILVLLTLMMFFAMRVGVFEQRVSSNEFRQKRAFHAAESGIQHAKEFFRANAQLLASSRPGTLSDGTPALFFVDKQTGAQIGSVEIPAEVNYGMSTYVHEGKQYLMLQTGSKLTAMALSDF